MASLEDVSSLTPINDRLANGAQGNTLAWRPEERSTLEKLMLTDAPATLIGLKNVMKAMEKPLRMWPDLYALMKPIRELMEKPLSQHQWKSEHYEAWDQAKEYMMKEMSFTGMDIDTDTDEEGDNSDQIVPEGVPKP